MSTFVATLVHDRPERTAAFFESLLGTMGGFRLGIFCDAPDRETLAVAEDYARWAHVFHVSPTPQGILAGLNTLLRYRRTGEDFCRTDSDIVFPDFTWLLKLKSSLTEGHGLVSPAWNEPPWPNGVAPGTGTVYVESPATGVWLYSANAINDLGAFRGHNGALIDLDYNARLKAAGYSAVIDSSVVVNHPGQPTVDGGGPRQQQTNEALPLFKMAEATYERGANLWEPLTPV